MNYRKPVSRPATLALLLASTALVVWADELPDAEVNPQSGDIESVASISIGGNHDIRHVVDPGQGGPKLVRVLTDSLDDDLSPRIAIDTDGGSWVVWWRDGTTDEVLLSVRDTVSGSWSTESVISSGVENSRDPSIVLDAQWVWVAFEIDDSGVTDIAVCGGGKDDPVPFPGRSILATSTYGGEVDLSLHQESGKLWVSWIDNSIEVGWREYDYDDEAWLSASYESYESDGVENARGRIRQSVLGS